MVGTAVCLLSTSHYFFSDEDSTNISQRETIRRQLADNSDEDKEELTNHNLLLCFLNENPESDLEDYETSSPALSRSATKIPNNHPLACLKGKIVFKNEVLGHGCIYIGKRFCEVKFLNVTFSKLLHRNSGHVVFS